MSLRSLGLLLELRLDLLHHPVLVQLGENRRHLALAVGVVQGVVDHLRRDPQPRGRGPVDGHHDLQPLVLEVAAHVTELRQLLERRHQLVGPFVQFLGIGVLQAVLVLGPAHPVLHGEVLHRLHVQGDALQSRQPGLQPLDDLGGADPPLAERLQVDRHPAAVHGGIGPVHPDKGRQARHRRVFEDLPGQGLLALVHGGKGDVLRAPPRCPG